VPKFGFVPAATVDALLPLAVLVTALLGTMGVFFARCVTGGRPRTATVEARSSSRLWKWWMEWWIWLWGPVERTCIRLGISPDAITVASTLLTAVAAVLLGAGHLSVGGWLYLFAASFDLVDGRVARATGRATRAGAFLDSTLDRVSELAVFAGLAVYFREGPALLASLAAAASSVLVSYARARGEALGAGDAAKVGGMQRPERVVLTGIPCALSPLADAIFGPLAGDIVAGSALALLAIVTSFTAAHRFGVIWRALREAEPGTVRTSPSAFGGLANVRWLDAGRRKRVSR
jgi:phosphatidylglycerophosphate synthase